MSRPSLIALLPAVLALAAHTAGHTGSLPREPAPWRGLFQYSADAALYTDCETGLRYPVAREGDYLALERAYLRAMETPGSPVLVTVRGTLEMRPGTEGNRTEETLVVEKLEGLRPGQSCGQAPATPLTGVSWQLTELDGAAVTLRHPERTPEILLEERANAVQGYSGCNRFRGLYTRVGGRIGFSRLSGTLRACPEEAALERGFFDALEHTTRFQIRGTTLEIYQDDQLLARFRANPPGN